MTAIRGIFAPIETLLARRSELVVIISVVVLFIVFATTTGENFLSNLAISNIVTFSAILGIIVLGVAVLMIAGEFDLSVGSMFAVVGFTFGVLLVEGLDPWLAVVISVAAGALLGFLNGVFVVGSGNPSFIITLGCSLATVAWRVPSVAEAWSMSAMKKVHLLSCLISSIRPSLL